MSKPHILFRFHKSFDVCAQNIRLLRKLNPEMPIHGMYGGAGGLETMPDDFVALFDSLYAIPFEDPQYNWQHGDICIRWWYKQQGHKLDFTHLCVVEWDMLYLKPMAEVYNGFQDGANYYARSGTYQELLDEGWLWIQGRFKPSLDFLLKEIGQEKHIDLTALSFGIFGGCVFCRRYLEELSTRVVRSASNDEVRHSVYAALFDVPMIDCGFLSDKRHKVNAENYEFSDIDIETSIEQGLSAIHPIRLVVPDLLNYVGV